MVFKFLTNFCLLCSSYAGPLASSESSGTSSEWVALSPIVKLAPEESEFEEDDLSVWVIFTKQLGKENFMVRFPESPKYQYLSPEEIEITSMLQEESYSLRVLRADSDEFVDKMVQGASYIQDNMWEKSSRNDGKWVLQTFYLTSQHLYIFQTENSVFPMENHQKFVSSLDIR